MADSSEQQLQNIMDGKKVAAEIKAEVKKQVGELFIKTGEKPKLCVVLVGERKDSATYVAMKEKSCADCGIDSVVFRLPETITQQEIEQCVEKLNCDKNVDGILVQLPLPAHINEDCVLDKVDYTKDVDGLHPLNVGHLYIRGRKALFHPCTAEGCVELCLRHNVQISGANVVVIGRSNIVGLPVAQLFLQKDATVTVCHSKTKDISSVCRNADILIVAIGKANFVKGDWVKKGCVIIDVGINAVDDATKKSGFRLVGDVDFEDAKNKCKFITPVPGGVGPMTVAILMKNTLNAKLHKI